MFKRVGDIIKQAVFKLGVSLRRFPEALFFCFATTAMLIHINHLTYWNQGDIHYRMAMVLALGIPAFLCVKLITWKISSETREKVLFSLFAVGFLALYFSVFLRTLDTISYTRYFAVSVALYLAFTFIPNFFKKPDYELYVMKLLTQFSITYIYSLVLYLGLAAILFTLDTLFAVNFSYRLYSDMLIIVAGVFAPAFFLADIPYKDEELKVGYYSGVLKVMLIYIVMPILTAYTAILYAFFIKILVTRQWPQGMVSNLVLWYSLITALVVFLVYPLKKENQWVKVFTANFPKIVIPLLAMMFVSMGIRIKAYGITENRYFVLVAGLWVTGSMLYLATKKDAKNIVLVISLALVTVLTVAGPWSSFSVSRYSQKARLENLLTKYDMIREGKIVRPAVNPSDEDKSEITSILRYFDRKHDLAHLKYFPDNFQMDQMGDILGFDPTYDHRKEKYFNHYVKQDPGAFNISGYDYFFISDALENQNEPTGDGPDISYSNSTGEIKISFNDEIMYQHNVKDIASDIHKAYKDKDELSRNEMSFEEENSHLRVLFLIESMGGAEEPETGPVKAEWVRFYLFVKRK